MARTNSYLNRPAETHGTGDACEGCRIICQVHLPLQQKPHCIRWPRRLEVLPCSQATPNSGEVNLRMVYAMFCSESGVAQPDQEARMKHSKQSNGSVQDLADIISTGWGTNPSYSAY